MLQRLNLGEYFGQPVRRLRAHGILITENRFEPNKLIERHEHTYPHLTAVIQGDFQEDYGHLSLHCDAGSVLVVPARAQHVDKVGTDGAHTLSVEVSRGLSNRIGRESDLLQTPRVLRCAQLMLAARSVHRQFRLGSKASLTAVEHGVLGFLLEAIAAAARPPDIAAQAWLFEGVQILTAQYVNPPSLSELARLAGVHGSHYSRCFRVATGMTIPEFVRERRLCRATELMLNRTLTLSEVAIECGFSDPSHFTRTFKARYGYPPSDVSSD